MKFNRKNTGNKVLNEAGGEAFQKNPKQEFVDLLLTSFVESQFYRSAPDVLNRVRELMNKLDAKFPAKASMYARDSFNMRSITHAVAGEIAYSVKQKEWLKKYFNKVVVRPDDMLEILSYYSALNNYHVKPVPNAMKKGFRTAINRFDSYQIAKYKGENKEIKMVDLLNLIRPKPISPELAEAFKKLVNGELKSTGTWETKLTQAGQESQTDEEKQEKKKQAWSSLIKEGKLGYMALLRNLRNIMKEAPELKEDVCNELVDKNKIKKSRVLPFRIYTAYVQLRRDGVDNDILANLSKALDIAVENVPYFDGKTAVVIDTSGSMSMPVSNNSIVRCEDIAELFGAILAKANNADVYTFSEQAIKHSLNLQDSVMTIADRIREDAVSSGTNFHAAFRRLDKAYDRIITLSDNEGWMEFKNPSGTFEGYKKRYGVNSKLYSFDLAGYTTQMFPERNVYCLSGYSEKAFDIMKTLEQDKNAIVKEIERIEL